MVEDAAAYDSAADDDRLRVAFYHPHGHRLRSSMPGRLRKIAGNGHMGAGAAGAMVEHFPRSARRKEECISRVELFPYAAGLDTDI
jgi:hypothetical protein